MKHLRLIFMFTIIALSLAALWITNYMMGIHAPVRAAASAKVGILADICAGGDEEEGGGCEEVLKSEHGYISIPWWVATTENVTDEKGNTVKKPVTRWSSAKIPVAQLGQCYYIFLLVWFAFTGLPRRASRRWHLLPMVLSIIAVLATSYYLYVMAFKMEQWCRLCVLLHLIDFLACGLVVALWPRAEKAKARTKTKRQKVPLETASAPGETLSGQHVCATLALVLALVWMSFLHREDQLQAAGAFLRASRTEKSMLRAQKDIRFVVGALAASKPMNIPPRSTQLTIGDPNARHELIMFTDLQCPACRSFEARLSKEILPLWKGQLKVTVRHYPLCTDCNKTLKNNKHPQACNAAYAVEAAYVVGGQTAAGRMHAVIVEKYTEIKRAGFPLAGYERFAEEIGLDAGRFQDAFQSPEIRRRVLQDIELARSLGITGTPTVFFDGRRLHGQLQKSNLYFWTALARNQLAAAARQRKKAPDEGMSMPPGG